MRLLRASQLSRQLLLIRHIADAAPSGNALAALDAARDRDPDAAARVIADPMIGAWTAHAVRKLRGGKPEEADLGQLVAVAAVAAAHAGVDADLAMVHHGTSVMIPTVGLLNGLSAGGTLNLRMRSRRLAVTGGEAVHREDLRHLIARGEPDRSVSLDDISPYRDVYHAGARGRLIDGDADRWRGLFAGAWEILSRQADHRMVETAELVRTVVPLREDGSPIMRSATARQVFGALGTTMPSSAAAMAVTLIHEGSHSMLNGVLQLEALFDPKDPTLYFAPWRPDPRPVWGLFHGIFAFLAVADLMNLLRAEPTEESAAERQFAKIRGQLRPTLDALLGASSLTTSGHQFAACMGERLARLETAPVSRAASDFATQALNDDHARRAYNGRAK